MDPHFYLSVWLLSVFPFSLSRCKYVRITLCHNRLQFVMENQIGAWNNGGKDQESSSWSCYFINGKVPFTSRNSNHKVKYKISKHPSHLLKKTFFLLYIYIYIYTYTKSQSHTKYKKPLKNITVFNLIQETIQHQICERSHNEEVFFFCCKYLHI